MFKQANSRAVFTGTSICWASADEWVLAGVRKVGSIRKDVSGSAMLGMGRGVSVSIASRG